MRNSKLMAAVAVLVPLSFASLASAQTPASPERPAKGAETVRAVSVPASAVAAPSPSARATGLSKGARGAGSVGVARVPAAAMAVAGPPAPHRGVGADNKARAGTRTLVGTTSSLDGVIPTLHAPDPGASLRNSQPVSARALGPLPGAAGKPRVKGGDGGAKN